jgi:hypothetical protein
MSGIVDLLAIETGLDTNLVERIMRTAPIRYKTYQIPKRGGGFRTISQPAKEVKILQRALVKVFLGRYIHKRKRTPTCRTWTSLKDGFRRFLSIY